MFNPIRSIKNSTTASLTTSASRILAPDNNRGRAIIQNTHASIVVWLGNASVAANAGIRLAAGETFIFSGRGALYALAASGTPSVSVTVETHVTNPVKSYTLDVVAGADSLTRLLRKNGRRTRATMQNLNSATVRVGNSGLLAASGGITIPQYGKLVLEGTDEVYMFGPGTNEVETITVSATGGTFTVSRGGQTTSALAYNISAANLQIALEGLSTIGAGNVTVSGTSPYSITFTGTLANTNVTQLTTNAASLTGGGGTAAVATTTQGGSGAYNVVVLAEYI